MTENEIKIYTPQVLFKYDHPGGGIWGQVCIELIQCPLCQRLMLNCSKAPKGLFSAWEHVCIESQLIDL